jgi:predicted transcriptional regulator
VLKLLGPLEARIMRMVWTGKLEEPFVVWDVQARLPELAYTTVMTTLARLADKGLLSARRMPRQRALRYRATDPQLFLRRQTRTLAAALVRTYGEQALAAFESELERLTPEQRRELRRLADR